MPLDIGAGILIALFVAHLFHIHADVFLIVLGIIFALLPDIDMLWYLFGNPSNKYDHRLYTHYPFFWLPIVLFAYIIFGHVIGTLLFACILMHLVHDTIGLGWGITWLGPFSKRRIRFLSPTGSKTGGWEFFRTWIERQEESEYTQDDAQWIRKYYLRPHIIGLTEYVVFLIGLAALYFYFI
ncbi:MAG TPA: metal-dependent hydrolase [Candidatus Paceibacterota bacterium]|nr:metal-dependent hydrolase [Candidatus Paceibacterota bacterium]